MILRAPEYFEQFHCIAGRCPDSCCKEWEIEVDENTAARYQVLSGALGDDLRRHLYRDEEGSWFLRIVQGRCPMWRSDGLCRIQAECGHGLLCRTCQDFPRLTHDYGDFIEQGLEMSCPEAARLIFAAAESPWVERVLPDVGAADYDRTDMAFLLSARKEILHILSDRHYTVQQSLALALLYGYQAQEALDGGALHWDADNALSFAAQLARPCEGQEILEFYKSLDILTSAWRQRLSSPAPAAWKEDLRTLARYGMERYFLQAISDLDIAGRVKMVVLSCIVVHLLGGDTVQTAQLYAKEIENSADNVDAILDGAYESPALTDDNLLGILLK